MRGIPKNELIQLLNKNAPDLVTEDTIKRMFSSYGDIYYINHGVGARWELCEENEKREKFLKGVDIEWNEVNLR